MSRQSNQSFYRKLQPSIWANGAEGIALQIAELGMFVNHFWGTDCECDGKARMVITSGEYFYILGTGTDVTIDSSLSRVTFDQYIFLDM